MSNHVWGLYDIILGYYTHLLSRKPLKMIDQLNMKRQKHNFLVEHHLPQVWSLTQYIEKILIKLEGFPTVEDYYENSSCTSLLHLVDSPLFLISALDDPIIGNKQLPYNHTNDKILLGVTSAGGHLSYFEGLILPHRQWFTEPSFAFLNHFIK